jgi:hypothetical protein
MKSTKKADRKRDTETEESDFKYYSDAFDNIKNGKSSWNWNAFCGGAFWLLYRKMYLYGILGYLLCMAVIPFGTTGIVGQIISDDFSRKHVFHWFLLSFLLTHTILGYAGSRLYFRIVKKRIENGYHRIGGYSPAGGWTVAVFLAAQGLGLFVLWLRDYFRLKKTLETLDPEKFDCAPTEENIRKLLSKESEDFIFPLIIFVIGLGARIFLHFNPN